MANLLEYPYEISVRLTAMLNKTHFGFGRNLTGQTDSLGTMFIPHLPSLELSVLSARGRRAGGRSLKQACASRSAKLPLLLY